MRTRIAIAVTAILVVGEKTGRLSRTAICCARSTMASSRATGGDSEIAHPACAARNRFRGLLFQGLQIGDDVGAIPRFRQPLEEHFRAVNVAPWIGEVGIQR